jgi:hypothetical protein
MEYTTTRSTLAHLPDEIRRALDVKIEQGMLAVPLDSPAFLTRAANPAKASRWRRPGPASSSIERLTALVIGPHDALIAIAAGEGSPDVLHARLEDLEIRQLDDVIGGQLQRKLSASLPDGIDIQGFPVSAEGGTGRGSYFLATGLPDGSLVRAALEDAIRTAKRP